MRVVMLVLAALALAVAAPAVADRGGNPNGGGKSGENGNKGGNGGGGGGGGGGQSEGGSLALVMVYDQNGSGGPNWNDQVTFDVSTTATDKPWVRLNCYQSGTWVSTSTAGFFPAYPWAPNFTLASGAWTSGAADCVATLYMVMSNGKSKTLAELTFQVDA